MTLRKHCAEKLPKCCNRFGRMLLMILNCPILLNLPPIHFTAALTENWFAYTSVLQKDIVHAGVLFRLAGLSCVATLPEYRKLGLGSCLVRSATDWMVQKKQLDFGIFTCQPEFIHFYHRCGGWLVNPNVTLIGNAKPGALNSKTLSVAVLQRIFSRHAQKHKVLLTHGLINLEFPDGEFL